MGALDADPYLNVALVGRRDRACGGERQGVEGPAHHRHVRTSGAARCLRGLYCVASHATASGAAAPLPTPAQ